MELTALLLTVAVVGAVVLSTRPTKPLISTLDKRQNDNLEDELEEKGEE